jgi:formate hydrogenlyase subunit 3/multisubunit Na+/H+ antiporter MnhD subunit
MGIFVFSLAAILSLPKQFITVYLGVILEQSSTGGQSSKSRIITDVVLAVTILITFVAMWYIFRQMDKVKPEVIYKRRKAR